MKNLKLTFIGGGKMAEAILSAMVQKKIVSEKNIVISEPDKTRQTYLYKQYKTVATTNNLSAIKNAEVILLCVKPQVMVAVLSELKNQIPKQAVVVSIAAGISLKTIQKNLAHDCVVRAMPNTPAQIGKGMTVWTGTKRVTKKQKQIIAQLLQSLGTEIFVPKEKDIESATPISGCGPAYIFLFMEHLIHEGIRAGLSQKTAEQLVKKTFIGSSLYAENSKKSLTQLRQEVTSPGGVTQAALESFEKNKFGKIIQTAIASAHKRSKELGK